VLPVSDVDLPATDYSALNTALEAAAAAAQLVPTPVFISKAQQLYEMILVRHGLMIVGYSYGAKTSIYRCATSAAVVLNADFPAGKRRCLKAEGRGAQHWRQTFAGCKVLSVFLNLQQLKPCANSTSTCRCLATALGDLEAKELMGEHKVHVRAINPKVGWIKTMHTHMHMLRRST
jgi:hypothetical protein